MSDNINERGCQLSLSFNQSSKKLKEYMMLRGVAVSDSVKYQIVLFIS